MVVVRRVSDFVAVIAFVVVVVSAVLVVVDAVLVVFVDARFRGWARPPEN